MSKSMFTLAAAVAAVAFAPIGAQSACAAGLPSIYDSYSEHDHALEDCTVEAPTNDGQRASGRIVAIDPAAGKITLDYRPLPLLPEGGVRVFSVEDPTALKGLSAGDRVRFEVERDGRRYVVTHLENSN
ncbi:copper-binding protein [Reyranella sp.]|uniref:copper-binding protein n=1 Tax=Reyranella sp. TaxID=1929291 RepID=UPI003C7DC3F9